MSWIGKIILIASLAAILTACGGEKAEPVVFEVEMSEYAFTPNTLEVTVGQEVTLELVNNGVLAHELMIGQNVVRKDNRPSGYEVDIFEKGGVEPEGEHDHMAGAHQHEGTMVVLEKTGDETSLTFLVTKEMVGEWELGCFEQEGVHYDAGMKGTLIVKP